MTWERSLIVYKTEVEAWTSLCEQYRGRLYQGDGYETHFI
jgi:hypothetical protein